MAMALPFTDADLRQIKHEFAFDPTCGFTLADLLAVRPPDDEPADLTAFWEDTYAQAMAANATLAPTWDPLPQSPAGLAAWQVSYTSWDGIRVAGWVCAPATGTPRGLIVCGHGYGTPGGPDHGWAQRGYASFQMCQRGFGVSRHDTLPKDDVARHVVHGVAARDTYILRGCVVEQWHAATLLQQQYPALAQRLFYFGGSFGGGLGAMALAWDRRFCGGYLGVPTFGHHPIRLRFPCCGSGESVRQRWLREPAIMTTLRYYDSACLARRITCPVYAEVAAFDPAVIPPGQFAVANAISAPGTVLKIVPCAHFDAPLNLWPQTERDTAAAAPGLFIDALNAALA